MKKTLLATAIVAATGLAAMSSQTFAASQPIPTGELIFANHSQAVPAGTFSLTGGSYNATSGKYLGSGSSVTVYDADFGVNAQLAPAEFRMVAPDGSIGGGGEKSLVGLVRDDGTAPDNGLDTITWGTGAGPYLGYVVSSDGDQTPGATNSTLGVTQGGMTNAVFFEKEFGFALDPANPVVATVDYDAGTINIDVAAIEAQWGNQFFPMGECDVLNQVHPDYVNPSNPSVNLSDGQGCGIHLSGTITNIVGNNFDFTLFGEHRITPYENCEGDIVNGSCAGFTGWVAQFGLSGSFVEASAPPIPVPAAVWLFGSGLLGLVGVARRKKAS